VAGGDGTVREAAEGIARAAGAWPDGGAGEPPALLVIPSGSGNSAYRALWGERPGEEMVDAALAPGGARLRVLDLARVVEDDRAALLGYNVGLLARIAQLLQANRGATGVDRHQAAIGQAVEELAAYPHRVTVDDELLYEGPTMLTTVGGVGRFGKGTFLVLPRSELDDGLLDVCVIGEVAREQFGEFAMLLMNGEHIGRPEVRYAQGRRVRIERLDGEPLVAEYDGDPRPAGPAATIEAVPAGFGALAPL
jgi:diacylglycerol kinase (ATP)